MIHKTESSNGDQEILNTLNIPDLMENYCLKFLI